MNELDWRIIVTMQEVKNLSETAQLLFMSQPTLTKRLQKIEDELGVTIAVRNKKGTLLTQEGDYLAAQGKKILKLLDEVNKNLFIMKGKKKNVLKVGSSNAFSRFFLPSILQKGKEAEKNIEFQITTDYSNSIVKRVECRELDAGFIFGDIPFKGVKYLLGINKAILVCNKPFSLSDLPQMDRIDYAKDKFTTKLIDSWWYDHFSSAPRIAMVASNGDTCREMVLQGLGYAIFTVAEFVENDESLYKLPMENPDGTPLTRNRWLICNYDYEENELLSNFINSVIKSSEVL